MVSLLLPLVAWGDGSGTTEGSYRVGFEPKNFKSINVPKWALYQSKDLGDERRIPDAERRLQSITSSQVSSFNFKPLRVKVDGGG